MAFMTMEKYDSFMTTTHSAVEATMEKLERLHRQAQQCRALADTAITPEARIVLVDMALDYEDRAATMQINGARSHPPIT